VRPLLTLSIPPHCLLQTLKSTPAMGEAVAGATKVGSCSLLLGVE